MPPDPEPSRDEMLAMAYVDGELDEGDRVALEARIGEEQALARHVAHYRSLEVLARQLAPPEPADHEWERLQGNLLHASGSQLGWFLLGASALGALVLGVHGVATTDLLGFWPRACLLGLLGGLTLLLALTIRTRVALLPFDPYRKVKR